MACNEAVSGATVAGEDAFRNEEFFLKSNLKRQASGEVSTAPSTPSTKCGMQEMLPSTPMAFERLDSTQESEEDKDLQNGSGDDFHAALREELEKLTEDPDPQEVPVLCLGMPPLQSDLAKWAQWAARAEEWQSEVFSNKVAYKLSYDSSSESATSSAEEEEASEVEDESSE